MMDQLHALLAGIARDPVGLARIALVVVIVLTVAKLMARLAWAAARVSAFVLRAALLLALLFGKPTRLGDLSALRQDAVEAARDLLG
jgi:hypothetical protein